MKNVEANKLSGVMSRLLKNEEGNIIALFAAAAIPVIGLIGGGFDMSRIYLTQTRLQGACDAGALIGRKTMGLGKWADNSNAAKTKAEKLFDQNFPSDVYGTTNRIRTFAESNGNVTGTASVTIPMTLMRVLGQESQTVEVNCQAELRVPNTDVMFVLDTTGSMTENLLGESKIVGLKKAVKCFYEALAKQNITDVAPADCGESRDPIASNLGNVQLRFGFVPYAVNVNVGRLLPLDYMADQWTYQSREASTGTGTDAVPIYGQESSPVNGGTKNTSVAITDWADTEENIVVGRKTYEWTSKMKKVECNKSQAPTSQTINEVGPTELVSQSPATPVSSDRTISEAQINDVFEGSLREGKRINLGGNHYNTGTKSTRGNARIILSSVEEVADFQDSAPLYRIRWQRCAGSADFYESNYGTPSTATSVTGIGPVGQQASPPPGGVLMFVELQYYFKPLIMNGFSTLTDRAISQVASMVVRENRDTDGPKGSDGIYNNEKVSVSTC